VVRSRPSSSQSSFEGTYAVALTAPATHLQQLFAATGAEGLSCFRHSTRLQRTLARDRMRGWPCARPAPAAGVI
jgi:hypothetical protein